MKLPVSFTEGYTGSLTRKMGYGGVSSMVNFAQSAISSYFPDQEANDYMLPLLNYIGHGHYENRSELDYIFLRGLQSAIESSYPKAWGLTRNVGYNWWHGYPPISTYLDSFFLCFLYASSIQSYINKKKKEAYAEGKYSSKYFLVCGIEYFNGILKQQGHIDCSTKITDSEINIDIHICPFCDGTSDKCATLLGVWDGCFSWLCGFHVPEHLRIEPIAELDEQSTGHHIIIKFLE